MIHSAADHNSDNIFTLMQIFFYIIFHRINSVRPDVVKRIFKTHIRSVVIVGIRRNKLVLTDPLTVYVKNKITQAGNRYFCISRIVFKLNLRAEKCGIK